MGFASCGILESTSANRDLATWPPSALGLAQSAARLLFARVRIIIVAVLSCVVVVLLLSRLLRLVLRLILLAVRLSSPPGLPLLPSLLRIFFYHHTQRCSFIVHLHSRHPKYYVVNALIMCLLFQVIVRCDHGPVVQSFKSEYIRSVSDRSTDQHT